VLFNSPVFLVFAAVFLAAWHMVPTQTWRLRLLVIASFIFYGYWDWRFIFLLAGSGGLDYAVALLMHQATSARRRTLLLVLSLMGNLGALAFFKYLGLFTESVHELAGMMGITWSPPSFVDQIVLPVGISFYTFQSLSYTIDVYRGRLTPTTSLMHFFAYLAMFPQLVAGPIERARHLLPQLAEKRTPNSVEIYDGWRLIVIGYFKKTCIADNIAPFVDEAFRQASAHDNGAYWWLVAAMFAVQIYGDFSGYSDIARGLARLMGLDLMANFDHPYLATSIRDFWMRWHISLSTWFRDYVYIPLGGSRFGIIRAMVALWLTMIISGLWHGAAWTFVAWGALHALYLTIERLLRHSPLARLATISPRANRFIIPTLGPIIVLLGVLPAWILFRADSITDAGTIVRLMFAPSTFSSTADTWTMPHFALALYAIRLLQMTISRVWAPAALRWLEPWLLPFLVVITVFFRGPGHAFIYFQF
jgi:D-alanyl-lipoteichoic acid acyltransferase DltB (MBOAT superfamily)